MTAVPMVSRLASPWLPHPVTIEEIEQEVPGIATYKLAFTNPESAPRYRFEPGQFNMLYLPGVGESAISVSSDPGDSVLLHTIRIAGNVTRALARRRSATRSPCGVRTGRAGRWRRARERTS